MRKLHVFDAILLALFEKRIVWDVKPHFEGVSEAKKLRKYMFLTQFCSLSSKKANIWI